MKKTEKAFSQFVFELSTFYINHYSNKTAVMASVRLSHCNI